MRAKALIVSSLICACALGSPLWSETRVVATTSQGKTKTQASTYREAREGALTRIVEEGDDPEEGGTVETLLAADGTVASTDIRMKQGRIRMTSDGKTVETSGTWDGKPISGRCELKGLGFYGNGFAFALRALAMNDLKSLKFPMINFAKPSTSTVMEIKRDGTDTFMGKRAIKVKLTLTGAMSALWSARILIGEDGTFYRYEGNQGPGTPSMVTELVEARD
jgi:hypothetical protein